MRPITTDAGGPEQRRSPRWQIKTAARLVVLNSNQVAEARTLDISSGGLSIIADFSLKVGTLLQVSLLLPPKVKDAVPLSARAEVMNCVFDGRNGGFRIGMQFVDIDATARAEIESRVR